MGKIVVSANVTLDGVVQDPTGDEGFKHGGWAVQISDRDREAWAGVKLDEALGAAALLLGRRSDEWFAARWSDRTGAWADRLNSLPKYVASSSPEPPAWQNSSVLTGDLVHGVTRLKQELDGDIVVYASGLLARALMDHHLVDELRLIVFPVLVGAGESLFGQMGERTPLRLLDTRTVGDGLASLRYEVQRG